MKLEDKFFNSFFYPFLIAIILNMIIVTIFLYIFTNHYLNKRTAENIVDLEKKSAKISINSVNALLTTTLLKVQASLNEQIIFYQKMANKKDEIINYKLNDYLLLSRKLDNDFIEKHRENSDFIALWYVDEYTFEENLENNNPVRLQLITYSNILPNIYSTLASTKQIVSLYSFFLKKLIY